MNKLSEIIHTLSSRTKLPSFETKFVLGKEAYREYAELAREDLGQSWMIWGREIKYE